MPFGPWMPAGDTAPLWRSLPKVRAPLCLAVRVVLLGPWMPAGGTAPLWRSLPKVRAPLRQAVRLCVAGPPPGLRGAGSSLSGGGPSGARENYGAGPGSTCALARAP